MPHLPSLRQVMSDELSLQEYSRGILPTFSTVRRRLMRSQRKYNHEMPDHYYANGAKFSLAEIDDLPALLTKGLHKLGDTFLEFHRNNVFVKVDMMEDWQDLITECSPLVIVAAKIHQHFFPPCQPGKEELYDFTLKYIVPNFRFTSIQSPRIPQLDAIAEKGGFHDLHIHLNGTTETDIVWLDCLRTPDAIAKEFYKALNKNAKAQQQLEQVSAFNDAADFRKKLLAASRIRRLIVGEYLFPCCPNVENPIDSIEDSWCLENDDSQDKNSNAAKKVKNRLKFLTSPEYWIPDESIVSDNLFHAGRHPFRGVIGEVNLPDCDIDLVREALMHVLILEKIQTTRNTWLTQLYHYYLLILGAVNKFLVQQKTQTGFEQFQTVTKNDIRRVSEETYCRRFLQLHGNRQNTAKVIEGRIAPRASSHDNYLFIRKIQRDFQNFRERIDPKVKLRLIAHFIKNGDKYNADDGETLQVRFRNNRAQYWKQARALALVRKHPEIKKILVGIDAASNELETPPEVFGPVYRFLRRNGFQHFTYHAGEDFHHLLGGMRAIFEAVEFLDLQRGDRIGHATAAGIDPDLWAERVGDYVYVSQGEWMDDLIFARCLMAKSTDQELHQYIPRIDLNIAELCYKIYNELFQTESLVVGWKLRRFNPALLLARDSIDAGQQQTYEEEEWNEISKEPISDEVRRLCTLYHTIKNRSKYDKQIKVKVKEIIPISALRSLQDELMNMLHKKEIVFESLPTSNLRISFYQSYKQHHIWRWLGVKDGKWQLPGNVPSVVLGTDDAGIFATNMYNEYAHLFNHMVGSEVGLDRGEATRVLKELEMNSKTYRFRANAKFPGKKIYEPDEG